MSNLEKTYQEFVGTPKRILFFEILELREKIEKMKCHENCIHGFRNIYTQYDEQYEGFPECKLVGNWIECPCEKWETKH